MTAFSDETGRGWLPLKYEDGPDFCTVTFATGAAFALTVHPERMKLMEAALSASPVETMTADGNEVAIEHDGFIGTIQGHYVTREGKRGVVLQQVGTRVVHVYGEKWIKPALSASPVAQEPVAFIDPTDLEYFRREIYADAEVTSQPHVSGDGRDFVPLYTSPPATSAGVGADEIARACDDLRGIGHCGESTSDKIARQRRDAVIDEVRAAILALLSRAGDQK